MDNLKGWSGGCGGRGSWGCGGGLVDVGNVVVVGGDDGAVVVCVIPVVVCGSRGG